MTDCYRFGHFELRPGTRQVLMNNKPAPLGARAFDVLQALIERRERLVTKDELLGLAWPGLVVEENNLQVQISALRKLLGADAIATVAGRGYRFTLEPALAAVPAPLPSRESKHNLPTQMASFIGRENEIRAIKGQLSNANVRLVTLTGPGGTGKTRLALQAAAGLIDDFADGVYVVMLAAIREPELLLPTIAQTLGVSQAAGQSLSAYLGGKRKLLLPDNFHPIVAAPPTLSALPGGAPPVRPVV